MEQNKQLQEILVHLKGRLSLYAELGFSPPPMKPGQPGNRMVSAESGTLETLQVPRADTGGPAGEIPESPSPADVMTLEELRSQVGECRRCKLHLTRRNLVFGEGDPNCRLVFVGEGPGRDEDLSGRPFVGAAGNLLTKIIVAMGLSREQVYICNIVKCRPPGNRVPEKDEIGACLPILEQQLAILQPKLIVTLGAVALQGLLGAGLIIGQARGRWHEYRGIRVMPTFHPAYLLRNKSAKRLVWEDVQLVMRFLGLEGGKDE